MDKVVQTIQNLLDHQVLMPAQLSSLSNFKIEGILGSGNFATVYKAKTAQGTSVAIKVLHDHISTEEKLETKFIQEVINLAKFNHPGIPSLTEESYLKKENKLCMIMEYIRGVPLNEIINRLNPPFFRAESGLNIMRQIVIALAYAHENGVIHRDIKPQNIMITTEGIVKIMDFGIAKIVSEGSTGSTIFAYTPKYAAPERMKFNIADERSDIYALGITFFEMLTGYHPAEVFCVTEKLISMLKKEINPPCIAEKLRSLKNKYFTDEDLFFQTLADIIGKEASRKYIIPIINVSQTGAALDQARLIYFHTQAPVPNIGRFRNLPEDLTAIVKKALDKNAANRFQSCRDLAESLERVNPSVLNRDSNVSDSVAKAGKQDGEKTDVFYDKTLIHPVQHTIVMDGKKVCRTTKDPAEDVVVDVKKDGRKNNLKKKEKFSSAKILVLSGILIILLAAGVGGWLNFRPERGKLAVASNLPADKILIDGQPQNTGRDIHELEAGRHKISVEKTGYTTVNMVVDVKANELKIVEAELKRILGETADDNSANKSNASTDQKKNVNVGQNENDIFKILNDFR